MPLAFLSMGGRPQNSKKDSERSMPTTPLMELPNAQTKRATKSRLASQQEKELGGMDGIMGAVQVQNKP